LFILPDFVVLLPIRSWCCSSSLEISNGNVSTVGGGAVVVVLTVGDGAVVVVSAIGDGAVVVVLTVGDGAVVVVSAIGDGAVVVSTIGDGAVVVVVVSTVGDGCAVVEFTALKAASSPLLMSIPDKSTSTIDERLDIRFDRRLDFGVEITRLEERFEPCPWAEVELRRRLWDVERRRVEEERDVFIDRETDDRFFIF